MAIIESRLETEKSYENPDFGVKELADMIGTSQTRILELFAMCAGEVRIQYNDYLFQKAGEEGNTEYITQKNWEHIIELLSTNEEVKRWLKMYKGREQFVHQWFVEDFVREPSESPEDLEWLTDHMLNFNNYAYNR